MFFLMLAALALVMVRPFLVGDETPIQPLRVDVSVLDAGHMQGIEWNRQRLLIVRTAADGHFLVVTDYDPLYGCPLEWIAAGTLEAPRQPWPGGLRATCTAHWFDATGAALTEGVADLKRLPFLLDGNDTLVISAPK
ncbi:MAG TPA: hypothetical protein VGE50_10520 [Gammaproteobacteria bacterium]